MLVKLKDRLLIPEQKLIQSLNTPEKIQSFIDQEIEYDPDREDRSVKEVIADRKAECYNAALFATLCLMYHGVQASILEILAREDEEHILCVYKKKNKLGAIAQSKFLAIKGRNPSYNTVRDLVVSYKEFYFAFDGRLSLASYTNPTSLAKYGLKWAYDTKTVVQIANNLRLSKHQILAKDNDPFYYVSPDRYWREVLIIPKGTKIPRKYLAQKPQ